jgi:rare lipoprotein A
VKTFSAAQRQGEDMKTRSIHGLLIAPLACVALVAMPVRAADPNAKAVAAATGERGTAVVNTERALGSKTASGERYDPHQLTAGHPALPFGTELMVKNPKTHKSVVVRVNDRAPPAKGRVLDLSPAAAKALGLRGAHSAEVTIEVVAPAPKSRKG